MQLIRRISGSSGFWALADQGLISIGNLATQLILARGLEKSDYGVFGLLFGVMLFLYNVHFALITYPLTLRITPSALLENHKQITLAIWATCSLWLLMLGILFIACTILDRLGLFIYIAIALLFWLLQETLRRSLMAQSLYARAIWGDAVSYLGQALLIWYTQHLGYGIEAVFIGMAASSIVGCSIQWLQLRPGVVFYRHWSEVRESMKVGYWVFLSNVSSVFTVQMVAWLLSAFNGASQVASLQAVANVLGVSHPVMFGIANWIVPTTARLKAAMGARLTFPEIYKGIYRPIAVSGLLIGLYYTLLMVFPQQMLIVFYGVESPYTRLVVEVRIFVVIYLTVFIGQLLIAIFNGIGRSEVPLRAQNQAALLAVLLGVPLIWWGGLLGLCIGVLIINTMRLIWLSFATRRINGLG